MSQTPFTQETYSPQRSPLRMIVDIANGAKEMVNHSVAGLGITWAQWVVLIRIGSGVGSSAAELCRTIGHDSGSMTRMLDRLEKAGLIFRQRCPVDRRVVKLFLTQDGKDLYPRLTPIAVESINCCLKGFSPQDVDGLMGYLDRIAQNIANLDRVDPNNDFARKAHAPPSSADRFPSCRHPGRLRRFRRHQR